MTVGQAVSIYLQQLQARGYSRGELARKERILSRLFTQTVALHYPEGPPLLKTLELSSLPAQLSTKKVKEFISAFRKGNACVSYLSLYTFLEGRSQAYNSSNPSFINFLQWLGSRLTLKSISGELFQNVLKALESFSEERASSYCRAFLIYCYEQGWILWNSHYGQRFQTERVFEDDFLGTGIWFNHLRKYLRYLKNERNLSAGGIDYYVRKLKCFARWIEDGGYKEVSVNTLKTFINHKRKEGLRESTLSKYLYSVRYFFDFLISNHMIEQKQNPAKHLRIKGYQYTKREALTEAELGEVIDLLEEEIHRTKHPEHACVMMKHFWALRDLCLFLLFVLYGLRLSEVGGMKLEDIDYDNRTIHIQAKGNREVRKKTRTLQIEKVVWRALLNYLKVRNHPGQPYLWISWKGCPLRTSSINNIIHRRVKKASIQKPISPHSLRTTCASLYVQRGMDPYSLKTLLGHMSLKTTMDHYTRLTEEQLRKVWKHTNPLAGFDDE